MKFCAACGAGLKPDTRFCPACGTPTAKPAPKAEPLHQDWAALPVERKTGAAPFRIILGVIALLVVMVGGYWIVSREAASDPPVKAAASRPDDPESLQDRFTSYTDDFLSEEQNLFITGAARVRNFPSSEETVILRELNERDNATGRWVTGMDPATRWLKLNSGGYVWEGNVGGPELIYPSGMHGLFVDSTFGELGDQYLPDGIYGYGPEYCETYIHRGDQGSVMLENYRATAFLTSDPEMRTQKGARIGMTVPQLQAAYEGRLEREANPYSGVDYYYWLTPNRGIRFHVGESGTVEMIHSGTQSIRYVEGCL